MPSELKQFGAANIPQIQKILIVRTDRIGDVVLSLPMVAVLHSTHPDTSISLLLRSYTKELVEDYPGLRGILLYDRTGGLKPFWAMLSELRTHAFDAVIVTYPTFRLALLMFFARIPVRIGTGYRWYSLLLNRRVYEHRKTAERHEAEFNLSLLRPLGSGSSERPQPHLQISQEAYDEADEILRRIGLENGTQFVILHPGSGGSARDWPAASFGGLAKVLAKDTPVVVSGGPGEDNLVQTVIGKSGGAAIPLPRIPSLKVLGALLSRAAVFVSNSTGPLHIAAAVGTPVVAFYPPILQCSPRRWGPLTDRKVIFEPDRNRCPRCQGGPCQGNDCMDLISVGEVQRAVQKMLAENRTKVYRKAR